MLHCSGNWHRAYWLYMKHQVKKDYMSLALVLMSHCSESIFRLFHCILRDWLMQHFTESMFSVCRWLCHLLLIVLWLCSAELACYLFYCLSCHGAKSHVCLSELTSNKISLHSCSGFHTLIWGVTGSGVRMQTMNMFTFLRTEVAEKEND